METSFILFRRNTSQHRAGYMITLWEMKTSSGVVHLGSGVTRCRWLAVKPPSNKTARSFSSATLAICHVRSEGGSDISSVKLKLGCHLDHPIHVLYYIMCYE